MALPSEEVAVALDGDGQEQKQLVAEEQPSSARLDIGVSESGGGQPLWFTAKGSTRLWKFIQAFCARKEVDVDLLLPGEDGRQLMLEFTVRGRTIEAYRYRRSSLTLDDFNLVHGDVLEATMRLEEW